MYSYSKIRCFFNCPLQFHYRYVEKVKVKRFESIEAFLGKRVHDALEKLYLNQKYLKENKLEDLIAYYETSWQKKYNDSIQIIKKQFTCENYFDNGIKYISDYYKKNFPFNKSTTLCLEKRINLRLDGYDIIGYIDRLSMAKDSTYEIHDYKTSGSMPPQSQFDKDEQLALYAIAVKNMYDGAVKVKLVWHYLAFNRTIGIHRTDNELDMVQNNVIRKIRIIEDALKEDKFLPNESKLCSWCEFKEICPVKNKQGTTGAVKKNIIEKHDSEWDRNTQVKIRNRQLRIDELFKK